VNTQPSGFLATRPGHHTGMVLLLCLLLLCSLTLVGLSATADSTLRARIAANRQDSERAAQTARTALIWAENWLLDQGGSAPQVCTPPCGGLKLHAAGSLPVHPEREDADWWAANGHEGGVDPLSGTPLLALPAAGSQPVYWLLESVHEEPAADGTGTLAWYRVLARATGRGDRVVSVVASLLLRSWPQAGHSADSAAEENGSGCNPSEAPPVCGRVAWQILR